jgi:hypothetical protein
MLLEPVLAAHAPAGGTLSTLGMAAVRCAHAMDQAESSTFASLAPGADEPFAGRFHVRRRLGSGASKEVYLAYDERLDRDVALAIMVGAGRSETARARVSREAQVTGRLGDHPNVVTVYDAGEVDGLPYLVLRAMTGGSLAEVLGRAPDQRPTIDEAIRLGREIACALAHAHAHGVVHRDVKPDNVWLAGDGSAALGDFGIAFATDRERLTAEGVVVGTVLYIAPEQASGEPVGPSADLYALGATLYEVVAGRPPFSGDTPASVVARHLSTPPLPPSRHRPDIPASLDRLILDLLAKRPDQRPRSAEAVAEALGPAPPARARAETPRTGRDGGDFVGRDAVMDRLGAAWADAVAGSPRVVALAGEPGIGKTRCAEELGRLATGAGATVGWGLCAEHEGAPPYWAWTRALRELTPPPAPSPVQQLLGEGAERADGESPEEARFRLYESIAVHLERSAEESPALLVLDDLHWADRSSLELLVHVARELRRARLLLLVTYRDGDLPSGSHLSRALGELARQPRFERLELRGLAPADIGRYVALTTGREPHPHVASAVHARTDGNPFLVGEIVRMLEDEGRLDDAVDERPVLPDVVRDVIGVRLDAVDGLTRAVLDAAAVVGREFEIALVARMADVDRLDALEALEPAARAHLVAPLEPPRCRFVHAIVHDVVYDRLPAATRGRLHARAGALLEQRRARGEAQAVAEIAHHLLEAARAGAEAEPALDASVAAAQEAAAQLAHAEAAGHYEGALEAADLAELADDARRCRLLLGLAEARRNAGDLDEAQRRYGAAAALARRLDSPDLLAEAALGYAEWQLYGVVDHAAIELLQDALARLPQDDSSVRAGLLGLLAVRLDRRHEQPRREALLSEAIAMARRLSDPPRLTRLLCLSPLVHWKPESAERRSADAAETIALAREAGDLEAALWAQTIRYTDFFGVGDIPAADAELEAYGRLASELRQPYYRWWLTVLRATREIFAGRFEEGRRLATEAVEHNRAHEPDSEQEYTVQMLMLAVARSRPREADAEMLRGFAERYPDLPVWRAIVACVDLARGDERSARDGFEALARAGFTSPARDPDAVATLSFAAEVCAGLGDAPRAAILHEHLLPYRDRNVLVDRGWGAWGAAAHQLGLLAATLGEPDLAAQHFERALELNRRWGARPWVLRTQLAAQALGVAGPDAVDEARALARELGLEGVPA